MACSTASRSTSFPLRRALVRRAAVATRSPDGSWQRAMTKSTRGLSRSYNRMLKDVFKGAGTAATAIPVPLQVFYLTRVTSGMREELAWLTLTRKIDRFGKHMRQNRV